MTQGDPPGPPDKDLREEIRERAKANDWEFREKHASRAVLALDAALTAVEAERDEVEWRRQQNLSELMDWKQAYDAVEARTTELEAALTDQCEMNEQSIKALIHLHGEWMQMIHEETYDGEPVISEALRCIVDDLDTTDARAALARKGDA